MADRELLEAAAKAAGIWVGVEDFADPIDRKFCPALGLWVHVSDLEDVGHWWNPLNNGDHALNLAVKLGIDVNFRGKTVRAYPEIQTEDHITEPLGADPAASTRRAITRAAAALAQPGGAT